MTSPPSAAVDSSPRPRIRVAVQVARLPEAGWRRAVVDSLAGSEDVELVRIGSVDDGIMVDILLVLGAPAVPPPLQASHPVMATWWFSHDRPDGDRAQPRLDRRSRVVRVELLETRGDRAGIRVVRRGILPADPARPARTLERIRRVSAPWPASACRALRRGAPVDPVSLDPSATALPGMAWEAPGGALDRARRGAAAVVARIRDAAWHVIRHDDWGIGVVRLPVERVLAGASIADVDWAPARRRRYAADPFGFPSGDGVTVLFEDYPHDTGIATIAERTWAPGTGWGQPKDVMAPGSHRSYPFLLEQDGERYLLPETRAAGAIRLHRWDAGGGRWRPDRVIVDRADLSDATLLRHGDRWWLFASRADRFATDTHLVILHAERLEGPWEDHALLPALVDVRAARPAGSIVRHGDQLLRPAQDCTDGYGSRVTVRRILELTPERFREETVGVIEPPTDGPYRSGLHTINGAGAVTLIDGKRRTVSVAATWRIIRDRLVPRARP